MAKAKRAAPVPLTRAQLETEAGSELLALAEGITEDGLVSTSELSRLHAWLHKHKAESLAAIAFLNETVDQIQGEEKSGGSWPRRRLHRALERVLPKKLRAEAKERRKSAETLVFNWGQTKPRDSTQPTMKPKIQTLIFPQPGMTPARVRAALERRLARGDVASTEILQAAADPALESTASQGESTDHSSPSTPDLEPGRWVARAASMPTPAPVARMTPLGAALRGLRYRGEMLWFEGQVWAVFTDPDDPEWRYAQPAAPSEGRSA